MEIVHLTSLSPAALGLAAVGLLGAANFAAHHMAPRHGRLAYAVIVILLCGTLAPAYAVRRLVGAGLAAPNALVLAPLPIALVAAAGIAFLALSIRGEPLDQWRRLPKLVLALLAPSLMEVLVFVGIVFSLVETFTRPVFGQVAAAAFAIVATSASFGLYHLTHAAPWNSLRMVRILFVVWLFVGGAYALTHNLWAVALLNTLLAAIGFVKNRVTRPEELSAMSIVLLDAAAIAAVVFIP